jgi:GT2 family glycosyltransferase
MNISVAVVAWNAASQLRDCLAFLAASLQPGMEVIVVDNGSADGTPEVVQASPCALTGIRNPSNMGAAYARNQAIASAKGRWICTLDADVRVPEDFFLKAGEFIRTCSHHVGSFQPLILDAGGSRIFSAGIRLDHLRRFHDLRQGESYRVSSEEPSEVFGACSAAAFYRRDALEAIREAHGYFDERFFFLVEDVDLAWRLRDAQYVSYCAGNIICFHAGDSSRTPRARRQYLCWRNRRLMRSKHREGLLQAACIAGVYDLPRDAVVRCLNPYVRRAEA